MKTIYNRKKGGEQLIFQQKQFNVLFITTFVIFITFVLALPPSVEANNTIMYVDAEELNMRSGPGLSYKIVVKLKEGDALHVLQTKDEWMQVETAQGKGWVASWMTRSTQGASSTSDQQPTNETIVAQTDGLNIRSGPSVQDAMIGKMYAGQRATLQFVQGNWAYIHVDGMNGWVHRDYITSVKGQKESKKTKKKTTEQSTFRVVVGGLNVREEPHLKAKKKTVVYADELYPILEKKGNWLQIELDDGSPGWVYNFHGETSVQSSDRQGYVTTLSNGTNLRTEPSTSAAVVARVDAGEQFAVIHEKDGWYNIQFNDTTTAYIASWVVSSSGQQQTPTTKETKERKKANVPGTLKGIHIHIDAGHGGHDRGTTGLRGTREKDITLLTAESLASKLREAGAQVTMTRNSDKYVSLRQRVALRKEMNADAFISLHYDANTDSTIKGFTTYYYKENQKAFTEALNAGLAQHVPIRNRGSQVGDFLVLRENTRDASLIELGFLTNATEEQVVTTRKFRDQATYGIYTGLLNFFN